MEKLPHFNQEQKDYVLEQLQTTASYKDIAFLFLDNHREYDAKMPTDLFVKKFVQKCRDYVTDKRKPEYLIIKQGRAKLEEDTSCYHVLMTFPSYRMEEWREIFEKMKDMVENMGGATNRAELKRYKLILLYLEAQMAVLNAYDRRELQRKKMEYSNPSFNLDLPVVETREVTDQNNEIHRSHEDNKRRTGKSEGRGEKMEKLPHLNQEQKDFVIECLQTKTPYKKIALFFRDFSPEYAAEMEEELYLEKFAAKCRRYVADKRRPEAKIIQEGRTQGVRPTITHVLMTKRCYREEQRQEIYDELEEIVDKILETTDPEELKRYRVLLPVMKTRLKVLDDYDRREMDREKMENSYKSGGHGITIPETVTVERHSGM